MAKNVRDTISASKVLIHIVDAIPNMSATSFTDEPLINFFQKYYGGGTSTFVDLGFDQTVDEVTDLTPSAAYGYRLDHTATDFTLTFPKVSSEKKSYLGSKDAAGTPNSTLKVEDPDISAVAVTLGGFPFALETIFMNAAAVSPTGWKRLNAGARPDKFGIIVAVIDNPAAPLTADNISMIHFLNDVSVTDAGDIKSTGGEDFERTINFESDATNHITEYVVAQNDIADLNQ